MMKKEFDAFREILAILVIFVITKSSIVPEVDEEILAKEVKFHDLAVQTGSNFCARISFQPLRCRSSLQSLNRC